MTRQEANNTLESYVSVTKDMNVIVPTWFNVISDDGTYNSLASKEYVDKALSLIHISSCGMRVLIVS